MTTFNYQGMEYDENYIKKHMSREDTFLLFFFLRRR
nr:MAG TPA: hypothetical protein [Caudoviricetes sp.]DAW78026.1 MAG TPA: hypothetical protein [Caudoviricetes sp.]